MKKCNKIIASLLAGVLLVSSVGVLPAEASDSDATVYVKEDFESGDFEVTNYASNSTVITGIKEYTAVGGGVAQHNGVTPWPIDATVIENEGNNVLKINERTESSRFIQFSSHSSTSYPTSGTYVFQASFKSTEIPFTSFQLKFVNGNASNKEKAVDLCSIDDDTFSVGSCKLDTDSWTRVRIVVNLQDKAYEIYINDVLAESKSNSYLTNFKSFRLIMAKDETSVGGLGSILVDNVALYKADAPVKDAFAEPTAIQLDQTEIHLNVNDTTTLTPTITTDGFEPAVTWTTSDETIATVDNGIVTACAVGTATITATAGDVSAECNVSIRKELLKENFAGEEWNDFVIEDTTGTVTIKTYDNDNAGAISHNSREAAHINAAIAEDEANKVLTITENDKAEYARHLYFSYASNNTYQSPSDKLVFQFSLKDAETSLEQIVCKIEGQKTSGTGTATPTLLTIEKGALSFTYNGNTISCDLSKDSWTTVRLAVDFSTKTYDIHVDDKVYTGISFSGIKNMKWFRFDISQGNASDGIGTLKVDNVALYQADKLHDDIFYATVDGTNLTLNDGNIGIKYHVNTDNLLSTQTDKMQFTMDGEATEVVNTDGDYIFQYGVPAKMMTETITAQLVDADGKALMYPVEYTIRDNALAIIEGSTKEPDDVLTQDMIDEYEKATPLATAMLNYGAYAQIHFDYNTDALANAGVVETDITTVTADSLLAYTGSDYVSVTGDTSIGNLVGTVVTLESNTYLKYYFLLDGSLSIDNLTFTDGAGNSLKATTNNGYCEVVIEGIKATDLNTPYTVNVTDGDRTLSATYCVMTNIYNVLAASEGTYEESHVNVCKALYLYNVEADKYFTAIAE